MQKLKKLVAFLCAAALMLTAIPVQAEAAVKPKFEKSYTSLYENDSKKGVYTYTVKNLTKGQTVRAKVLKVQEGKVSLSMRAIEEPKEQEHRQPQHSDKKSEEYISGEKASTSLSDLLADIKL